MSESDLFIDPNQVKMIVESIANEKSLPEEMIFVAMENALSSAMYKASGNVGKYLVNIDRNSGEYVCYKVLKVVETVEDEELEVLLEDAIQLNDTIDVGQELLQEVPFVTGRIFAHQTGQMITKFVREAERIKLADKFQNRVGELFSGQVKRVTKDSIILDLGDQIDACLPRKEILPREIFRVGDSVRAYLYAIDIDNKGPVLMLSRTHENMLAELFRLEVPEIQEGVLEIKSVARDPGGRSKIAVKTKDSRVDAIGACVGMRGGRVQAVSSELNNERVDIILWDESPAKMAISAMAPADIIKVVVDDSSLSMDMIVNEEALSQAIGRGGQNVKLASKLVGWNLNILSQAEAAAKQAVAPINHQAELCSSLDIDMQLSEILVREGFDSLDAISSSSIEVLAAVEEFDESIAEELIARAKDGLLAEVIALSENSDVEQPAECLLELDGMPKLVAYRLAASGIVTAEDLAELSVNELKHIKGLTDDLSAELIMAARKPWFEGK